MCSLSTVAAIDGAPEIDAPQFAKFIEFLRLQEHSRADFFYFYPKCAYFCLFFCNLNSRCMKTFFLSDVFVDFVAKCFVLLLAYAKHLASTECRFERPRVSNHESDRNIKTLFVMNQEVERRNPNFASVLKSYATPRRQKNQTIGGGTETSFDCFPQAEGKGNR
jgi:hypothetical protein